MLADLLDLQGHAVISITGSGGKTSLMLALAKALRGHKTLITTTTKIYPPSQQAYDYFYTGSFSFTPQRGVTLLCKETLEDGKLAGYDTLPKAREFDYAVVESDGSKKKLLKAWADHEPVILSETTMTIGVINLTLVGWDINEDNIHRCALYREHFCRHGDKLVDLAQIKRIILSPLGLFKGARGRKVLLLNHLDNPLETEKAIHFLGGFTSPEIKAMDRILLGSFREETQEGWRLYDHGNPHGFRL